MTGEATVAISVLRSLLEFVETTGISDRHLTLASALEVPALGHADTRVSLTSMYRLCERALELTGDPALGLHWADRPGGHAFHPVSYLIAHSVSLRQGFETLLRFHRLLSDQAGFELQESDGRVTVRALVPGAQSAVMQRFVSELVVVGFFKLLRSFGVPARSIEVHFCYPCPCYGSEYARVFAGAERFEQPFTGLVFDRVWMSTVSPYLDDDVHDALRVVAERRLLQLTQRTPFSLRVRELLLQYSPTRQARMDQIAGALRLSVRSLRRRLSAEGKTFRAIVNEARSMQAKQLLRTTQRTIQEIGFEMGFADTSAFHRAFKRGTGMTPQAYRAMQLRAQAGD